MDTNLNNITKMYDKLTYYDQYGVSPITGYKYFTYGGGNEIYQINQFTGEIGYGTGDFC